MSPTLAVTGALGGPVDPTIAQRTLCKWNNEGFGIEHALEIQYSVSVSHGKSLDVQVCCAGACLATRMVKNPPPMLEIRVRCLSQDDCQEKGMVPTLVFLPGESHGQRSLGGCSPRGHEESDTTK